MYRRRRHGALQSVVSAHTWLCVSETFTFEEHRSSHINSRFGTPKSEQLNQFDADTRGHKNDVHQVVE